MRGSPLIPVLALAVVLLLAGIPVWSLTRPHEHAVTFSPTPAQMASARPMEVTITSTAHAAVELRQAGRVIWQSPAPGETFSPDLSGVAAGTDVVAHVRWMESTKANAARLVFSRDGETLADTTLWGERESDGVVSLP